MSPAGEPAASLDADPARGAEHLDDATGRTSDRRVADDARARRQRRRLRADDRRERVDAREQVEERARRQCGVELLHDRRALDLLPQPRLGRGEEGHRRADPDDRQAERAAEEEAAGRVEQPQGRQPQPAADEGAGVERSELEEHRSQHGADEPRDRRPRRAGPASQDVRGDAGADVRTDHKPDERERADDKAAPQARERREEHDRDRDPVGEVEPHRRSVETGPVRSRPATPARLHWAVRGGVVQLVRTPACHAGGRGFESRRSRSITMRRPSLQRRCPPSSWGTDGAGALSSRLVRDGSRLWRHARSTSTLGQRKRTEEGPEIRRAGGGFVHLRAMHSASA